MVSLLPSKPINAIRFHDQHNEKETVGHGMASLTTPTRGSTDAEASGTVPGQSSKEQNGYPLESPLCKHKSLSDPNLISSCTQDPNVPTSNGNLLFLSSDAQPLSLIRQSHMKYYDSIPKPIPGKPAIQEESDNHWLSAPNSGSGSAEAVANSRKPCGARIFSLHYVAALLFLLAIAGYTRVPPTDETPEDWPEEVPLDLNSREYKGMLDASKFHGNGPCDSYPSALTNLERDLAIMADKIGASSSGAFRLKKGMPRSVEMYDTPGSCKLNEHGWIFRMRKKSNMRDYEGTLKVRSGDRYFSSYRRIQMNQCCSSCTELGSKFEEDMSLSWTSKFSYSHKCAISRTRNIHNLGDIAHHWHEMAGVFSKLGWSNSEPIERVAGLTVSECVYKGFQVDFGAEELGEFSVTLWYDDSRSTNPALAEMSFSLGSKGSDLEDDMNEKTIVTIMTAHSFWNEAADLSMLKPFSPTKTAWLYGYNSSWCGS